MPTYYVNDHNSGNRVMRKGSWHIRYTTGSGNDTNASPCEYGYNRYIKESLITNRKSRGFCNAGGRAWVITTKSGLVEDSFLEPAEDLESKSQGFPGNVRWMNIGQGLIIFAVDREGLATALTFVPHPDAIEGDIES
tara:strand:- start:445 stop:855 length:411 start_codon:yes stop_codon:yes gene_type:complete